MSEGDPRNLKLIGGWLCLDFVNTVDCRNSDDARDLLSAYDNLVTWSQHAGIITDDEARDMLQQAALHPTNAKKTLERAVMLREVLYRIFSSIARDRQPNTAEVNALNREVSTTMTKIRLKPRDAAKPWVYTYEGPRLDRILWPIIHSATELLTSDKLDRVRECPGRNCGWMFLDRSRNRTRKWCDMKDCGNRVKAQRHYQLARTLRAS
jgi:predicted RNA-binding Zn ribbon-like protein